MYISYYEMNARVDTVIVADDFTGACDTAVQFVAPGKPCPVFFVDSGGNLTAGSLAEQQCSYVRLVVDTESRHLGREEAHQRLTTIAEALRNCSPKFVYKKVDSTLRGEIATEIEAIWSHFNDRVAVLAPAYPSAGRTTSRGRCLVHGVPVHETSFGYDLRSPVRSSVIEDYVPHGVVVKHATTANIATTLRRTNAGEAIIVDATTDNDLELLARSLLEAPERYLVVASAGLATALRRVRRPRTREPEAIAAPSANVSPSVTDSSHSSLSEAVSNDTPLAPVIAIVGSVNARSRRQTAYFAARRKPFTIQIRPHQPPDAAASLVREVEIGVADGQDVLVTTVSPPEKEALRYEEAADHAAKALAASLGTIACKLLHRFPFARLFLTGGDTAMAVIEAVNASMVHVRAEVEPGVPVISVACEIAGRRWEICAVTKAGGFGEPHVIDRSIEFLKEGKCSE